MQTTTTMSVRPFLFFVCSSHFSCLFVVFTLRFSMSLDVFLSISHLFFMVRGSGDESKTSGKPEYDGTLKDWASAKITIKSCLHQKRKWLVTQYRAAKKQPVAKKQPFQTVAKKQPFQMVAKKQLFQTPAPMQGPAYQTPAPMQAPATNNILEPFLSFLAAMRAPQD